MGEGNAGQNVTGRGSSRDDALQDLANQAVGRWGNGAVVTIVREQVVVGNPKVTEYRIIGTGG